MARDRLAPLAPLVNEGDIVVRVKKAVYRVPERLMLISAEVENQTDKPLFIGEFSVANVRFINAGVEPAGEQGADELIVRDGLRVDDNTPIVPGETKILNIEARDAAWEIEKLGGLIRDADSRMGGLLFLYDTDRQRHIVSLSAPVIPEFDRTDRL